MGRPKTAPEVRFFQKVEKTDGCWLWLGGHDKDGYGFFWDGVSLFANGKPRTGRATHWIYRHLVGPIPEGKILLHSCDTPACVNPDHLTPGTHGENSADRVAKGRSAVDTNSHAKVTPAQVEEIRARYQRRGYGKHGRPTQTELAAEYGLTQCQISKIILGQSRARREAPTPPAPSPPAPKPL